MLLISVNLKQRRQQQDNGKRSDYNTLPLPKVEDNRKKYCRFKKNGIKYIDYKDANFLLKFINDQGKLLPRRLTGTSLKVSAQSSTGC